MSSWEGFGEVRPVPTPSVPTGDTHPPFEGDWKWDICQGGANNGSAGTFIVNLDPYLMDRQMTFDLDRPASATGKVAANNPVAADILPGSRTLKCYRFENGDWQIRFAGIIYLVDDEGDENSAYTQFTAYDPFQMLFQRMIRRNDGDLKKTVTLANNAAAAVKRHIEKTIEFAGACYIDVDDGYFEPGLIYMTHEYEQEYLGRAFTELTDTGVVDVNFLPVDRNDGILVTANAMSKLGSDVSGGVAFQYSTGNHQAQSWKRHLDMGTVANSITNFNGTKKLFSFLEDSDSQDDFGVFEDCRVLTDIVHQDALDGLTTGELSERKNPRENIAVIPMPATSARLFLDYGVGDTVSVECSDDAREAVSGVQRIYGITLDIDNEGVERVNELRVSPNLG